MEESKTVKTPETTSENSSRDIKDVLAHKHTQSMIISFMVVLAVVGLVTLTGFVFFHPHEEVIVGQAEVEEVRISGKVPGRITEYLVEEGQMVHRGDTLVRIYSPEVLAKLEQAEAAKSAAQSLQRQAGEGTNRNIQNSVYEIWQSAQVGLDVTRKSYERVKSLYEQGVISAQKFDEVEAKLHSMEAAERAAKSQYELSKRGLLSQDKATMQALVSRTDGLLSEVSAYLDENTLTSPIDGMVTDIFPHRGELVGSGAPVMNIADTATMHILFAIREDKLQNIARNTQLEAYIPALGNKRILLRVVKLKDMGTYAAWKATKPTGQIDVRTFRIKTIPIEPVTGLMAGMSVVLDDKKIK